MRILIIYYTRTGTTRIVAEALKQELNCDLEEIIDLKDRSGAAGWIMAGRDALRGTPTKIADTKFDPAAYDLLIVGSPVWAGTFAPAIRTYLDKHKDALPPVAAFSTQSSSKRQRIFDELKKYLNKDLRAEMFLPARQARSQNNPEIKDFINLLR